MADHATSKLDQDNHLILDQPLLRLPLELLATNFRSARFQVERDTLSLKSSLKDTATGCMNGSGSQEDVLKSLDSMIAKMRGVKRKLTICADEEARLHKQEQARVRYLSELYDIHSIDDVKYEGWSRKRLDRLLVDYMLRHGYNESARSLATERDIEDLVDLNSFEQMSKIRQSLLNGNVQDALTWCTSGELKKELRKMDSNLEFNLRLQQYIELVRTNSAAPERLNLAIDHFKKFLTPYRTLYPTEVQQAAGLLACPPSRSAWYPAYHDLYSTTRWQHLADLFTTTHNNLLSLPPIPLLHIALSSGLSALKTPACHSSHPASTAAAPSASTSLSLATSVCPICSTELNELARSVPYAHHDKSYVESDLLLLPNGRVYGKARLEEYGKKAGLLSDQVKDLRTGEVFGMERLKKVYIT